ncbi:MAG: ATP-binding cassette domain-containing protein [Jatrophihabitans sp.]|uniref:ATP-binding cassette domain-containing protein n=1 Tax=Jatrophihabitans sp. TaxID=1932789 RepID=UPI003F80E35B
MTTAPQAADAIRVDDAFCLYQVPGGATVAALRGLTLRVAAGERLVVQGPNGSGKTTLLRLLSGEVTASAGSVAIAGVELAGATARTLAQLRRDGIGLVDQHAARTLRPELDVLDNVSLHLRLAGGARDEARAAARALLGRLGLDALAERRGATLSGGEAQRVAVCAAVAHRPTVLLADEPTGELDLATADAVYDLLAAAAAEVGAALVVVSHDHRAGRIADRVVRIRDGRLSEQWRPDVPDDEELVVDARGWVRLPERARRLAGLADAVRVRDTDAGLLLSARARVAPPPAAVLEVPTPTAGTAPLAAADGLALAYGDRTLFRDLALELAPASFTVLRGRSGAGKSTLLRLLLGLADPDAGTVVLGGRAVGPLDRAARAALRRDVVAVSTQAGSLGEDLDPLENLELARAARGLDPAPDVVSRLVEVLQLGAVARRPARLLSGGERQRVALARSLVVQRPLLVLDEPTSQQDEAHAELVAAVLAAAASAGAAVLAATHDPLLVAAADGVVELT